MLNSNQKQETSRYDLKKQLQGIEPFDISSFCQSKNQSLFGFKSFINNHKQNILFPTVNAPTLQLLENSYFHVKNQKQQHKIKNKQNPHKKFINLNIQDDQDEEIQNDKNLTARNKSITKNNNFYEENINQLNKALQKEKKQKLNLQEKLQILQVQHKKTIDQLKQKNKQQRDQIKLLKERQIKLDRQNSLLLKQLTQAHDKNNIGRQSRAVSICSGSDSIGRSTISTSFIQDISCLSPQLLSPEQTVLLLSKLLKKVSKSSKMIKQLTNDSNVKVILSKMHKKQN